MDARISTRLAAAIAVIVVSAQILSIVLEWQDHQRASAVSRVVDE